VTLADNRPHLWDSRGAGGSLTGKDLPVEDPETRASVFLRVTVCVSVCPHVCVCLCGCVSVSVHTHGVWRWSPGGC
jgi:hypothetical protein